MPAPQLSFEFFPPKTEALEAQLWACIRRLAPLRPRFVSVTYGAGGSTQARTHATVARILRETALTPAAHLTCVDASRAEVDEVARRYWEAGVRHIVALRGDQPAGAERYEPHPEGYAYAVDLVEGLRRIAPFEVSVAAYPESHPTALSADHDLDNLKRKLDAGASRAITQFFFAPETFLRFRDAAAAAGFTLQVVEPHLNGPGGDCPIILHSERLRAQQVICGQGPAPRGLTVAKLKGELGLDLVPGTGFLCAPVPGAFDAWALMLRDHGTWELRDVLAYAIGYARAGAHMVPRVSATVETVRPLFESAWPTSAALWLRDSGPKPGELYANPVLADTYERVVREAEAVLEDLRSKVYPDLLPASRPPASVSAVRARYDRIRAIAARAQA